MRTLVLGSNGMAGHMITIYLTEKGYDIENLSKSAKLNNKTILFDLTKLEAFEAFLEESDYDVIVNCVGMLVEQSESRKDLSTYLNSFLPHLLEYKFKNTKTKIIHLSTDCVFSGKNPPYYENSLPDGSLFYDKTKALGEIINDKDLTFRMSIVGPDISNQGIGLFNWFQKQSGNIYGYSKAMWTGVTTLKLAEAVDEAIKQDLTGLYHLVPKDNISKFELLKIFKEAFNRSDINIQPNDNICLDKTLINTRSDFSFSVPDYKQMITELSEWMKNHKALYQHYFSENKQ